MIMGASTALVKDRESLLKMRNFTYALNSLLTLGMIFLILPPVFAFITETLLGLPERVSSDVCGQHARNPYDIVKGILDLAPSKATTQF